MEIRVITLYCLVIFNKSTGNSRVFTFHDTASLMDAFFEISPNTDLFPYTFSKHIYITQGHPLFELADPVVTNCCTVKVKY